MGKKILCHERGFVFVTRALCSLPELHWPKPGLDVPEAPWTTQREASPITLKKRLMTLLSINTSI